MKQANVIKILVVVACTSVFSAGALTKYGHLQGWYPKHPASQKALLSKLFAKASGLSVPTRQRNVRFLVVPHAGMRFSGLAAASGYRSLLESDGGKNQRIKRVIVLAPSHSAGFKGVALPDYDEYVIADRTISVDTTAVDSLEKSHLFTRRSKVHNKEHSLEIQLPFLLHAIEQFELVPLIIGEGSSNDYRMIAQNLLPLIDDKTVVVVSTDFTHQGDRYDFKPATRKIEQAIWNIDGRALEALLSKSSSAFQTALQVTIPTAGRPMSVCGRNPLRILLSLLSEQRFKGLEGHLACYYTSAHLGEKPASADVELTTLLEPVSDTQMKNSVSYATLVFAQPTSREQPRFTGFEKLMLLQRVDSSLDKSVGRERAADQRVIKTKNMMMPAGVFITLKTGQNKLRGCIGRITTDDPLYKTVDAMTQASALHDRRFTPVRVDEVDTLLREISILTPPRSISDVQEIKLGKHGIMLQKGAARSVYLPEVATDQGWNLTETLEHLSTKAGLSKDGWRGAQFKVFDSIKIEGAQ